MDRTQKTPDELARLMSERIDDPSKRWPSRPDDHMQPEVGVAYLCFLLAQWVSDAGLQFLIPLLLLLTVASLLSIRYGRLRLWASHRPTPFAWTLTVIGLGVGLAYG